MKDTRGTRDFPRDVLAYAKWLQRRSPAGPASMASLRLIARAAWAVALLGSSDDKNMFLPLIEGFKEAGNPAVFGRCHTSS